MPHKWRKRKSEYSEQTVQTDRGTYVCFTVRWDEPSAEGSITVADPRPTAKRFSSTELTTDIQSSSDPVRKDFDLKS